MKRVAFLMLAVLACKGGCAPNAPLRRERADIARGAASTRGKSEGVVSAPAAEPPLTDENAARTIDGSLCSERHCCVSALEPAGKDRNGRALVVATLDMVAESCVSPASVAKHRPDQNAQGDERDCHPYEYRLVRVAAGKVDSQQLLVARCNDGYGAAGVGEDEIAADPDARTFTYSQSGGSSWRWNNATTVGLDPLRVVSRSESSFWTLDDEGSSKESEWNLDSFVGSATDSTPDCEGRRKQEAESKRDPNLASEEVAASRTLQYVPIPHVQLPAPFVSDEWRTTALGACAAFVDGDQHGFAVHGGLGKAADATLRAVVSTEGVLFAEISDDEWTIQGSSWIKEDHLELWLAPETGVEPSLGCDIILAQPPTRDPSRQWGIRISDGAVFASFGSPQPLANVEVTRAGSSARVKIPLGDRPADEWKAITVVYSDSDDGKHQKRLIATSVVERGHADTLGRMIDVDASKASCATDPTAKALRIVRPPLELKPDDAIIE